MTFVVALPTLFLLLQAPAPAPKAAPPRNEHSDHIQADVARLASGEWQGRRAGTVGADLAAEWIAAEFRRANLKPGAADGTYFQAFSFIDGVVLGPGNRLALADGPAWKAGEDFRPLALSAAGSVDGEVAFVGYGIVAKDLDRDDYAGVDVKDRVVLVLRFGPDGDDPQSKWAGFTALRMKAAVAREHGAKALLVVTGPRTKDVKDGLVPLRAEASLADAGLPAFSVTRAVAETLLAPSGRTLEAAQNAVDESGKPGGFVLTGLRLQVTADVTPKRATTRNVIGLLPGATPEAVVIGAHYDHLGLGVTASLDPSPEGKIHFGADDNASGTAALLELCRDLSASAPAFWRSILFVAFAAEEEGALGSSHFVAAPPLPLTSIAAMINMDMVGRLRDDTLGVHGVGTSPIFKRLLEDANRNDGLKLRTREGGYGPSDQNAFYAAGKPVLFLFTGAHADYHRPSDTAEKINSDGIARVVSFIEPVIAGLTTSADPIPFTRVAGETDKPPAGRNFRVWVGGIPDFSGEGPGVKFMGVTPNSPAEKAGIQAGDVLVRFGDKEIRNIYDYTFALGEKRPNDVVTLVVQRGDQQVSIVVTLGARASEGR